MATRNTNSAFIWLEAKNRELFLSASARLGRPHGTRGPRVLYCTPLISEGTMAMSANDLSNEGVRREPGHGRDGSSDADANLGRFLVWLGPDKYVQLHRKLVLYFQCNRRARRCEELADKTLDRVARNFAAGKTPDREHIDSYVLRGASFLLREIPYGLNIQAARQ
jgi:hypothetical protein